MCQSYQLSMKTDKFQSDFSSNLVFWLCLGLAIRGEALAVFKSYPYLGHWRFGFLDASRMSCTMMIATSIATRIVTERWNLWLCCIVHDRRSRKLPMDVHNLLLVVGLRVRVSLCECMSLCRRVSFIRIVSLWECVTSSWWVCRWE